MILDVKTAFQAKLLDLDRKYEWFTLPTPKGSMTNTELFFIYEYILKIRPGIIFESGIGSGRSTLILASCMQEIGQVIAANFRYPDDEWHIQPFVDDFDNLTIVDGKGENVAKTLPHNGKIIAIVDGPKPNGKHYGRPGWEELIDVLANNDAVKMVFQHDLDDDENRRVFDSYRFKKGYIDKRFLRKNDLYGAIEAWKETVPNLGYFIFKSNQH